MSNQGLKRLSFLGLRVLFLTFFSALTALPFIWMVDSVAAQGAGDLQLVETERGGHEIGFLSPEPC